MNFIKSIHNFIRDKKIIKYFLIFFVIYYLSSDSAFAADFNEIKESTQTIGEGLLKGISMILALFTYLATIFLSPTWLNGSLFGLNTYFKDIWILVSNLVYFIFAFVLIWIAFMNIIGKNTDQYQLKQALPKFIVGVLIVPFSWFIIQFMLSLSAVLTVAGLSLPFETFDSFSSSLNKVEVPKNCTLDLQSFLSQSDGGAQTEAKSGEGFIYCDKDTMKLTEISASGDSNDSIFGILAMYTYGILSLDTVDDIDSFDLSTVKTMGDLVVKIVFDLLFVLIYSILMIALGMVLMIRGIYIWIYIMMSPVFGLMYFFGEKMKGDSDSFFSKFTWKNFIALAMVPVYTMLALSFGLLFIYVVGNGISGGTQSNVLGADNLSIKDDGLTVGNFKLTIKGQVSKMENATGLLKELGGSGLGIVGSLILKVFGIIILWGTVMAALRTSDITKTIISPLESFGKQVGTILTSAPGNIPIFPTGKGGMQSMSSLSNVGSQINSAIGSKSSARAQRFMDTTPFGADKATSNANVMKSKIIGASSDPERVALAKEILKGVDGDAHKLYNHPMTKENLYELAKKILGEDKMKSIDVKSSGDINNLAKVAKIYDEIEKKGGVYGDVLPGGIGGIREAHIIDEVRALKNSSDAGTASNAGNSNQANSGSNTGNTSNINITVDNNKIQNISGVTELSDPAKIASLQGLSINSFTKAEFIAELQKPNIGLDVTKATEVANKIPDTNFKINP